MTHKSGGFASMSKAQRQAIARRGGLKAQELGTAHQFTPEEAREAGIKGGKASARRRWIDPLVRQHIAERLAQGEYIRNLAEEYQVSITTIQGIKARMERQA